MKTRLLTTAVLLTGFVLAGSQAFGQTDLGYTPTYTPTTTVAPSSGGYALPYSHSSTEAEGVLNGYGSMLQGAGYYNFMTAQSMIAYEQARTQWILNHKTALQTKIDMRKQYYELQALNRGPRPTAEQFKAAARAEAPKRLAASEYRQDLGLIEWPGVLSSKEFDADRKLIDELVRQRNMENSGLGTSNYREITLRANAMLETLRDKMDDLSPQEFMSGKSFLTRLQFEARFLPTSSGLVSR